MEGHAFNPRKVEYTDFSKLNRLRLRLISARCVTSLIIVTFRGAS